MQLLIAVRRLLIAVASLVAEHGLKAALASGVAAQVLNRCSSQAPEYRLRSCGAQASLL